jgi:ribonuclease BN (tRNA processing enzyme)
LWLWSQALVLTHFSQRYPHIPVLPADGPSATGFAFDYMRLPFRYLSRLPALLPALQLLFEEKTEEEEAAEGGAAAAAAAAATTTTANKK